MTRRVTARQFSHASYAQAQKLRADARHQGREMSLGEALRLAEGEADAARRLRLETEETQGNA